MQAMKMNITFCVSSMPNQDGQRNQGGNCRLRPNSATRRGRRFDDATDPAMMPSGTPTRTASPKPIKTR